MCGPKFCSMKISQEVRDYAAAQDAEELEKAAQEGMEQMAEQYNTTGRQLYHKV